MQAVYIFYSVFRLNEFNWPLIDKARPNIFSIRIYDFPIM